MKMEEKWKKGKTGIEKYTDKKCKISYSTIGWSNYANHKTTLTSSVYVSHVTELQTFNVKF